jgi:hypothetical protein
MARIVIMTASPRHRPRRWQAIRDAR